MNKLVTIIQLNYKNTKDPSQKIIELIENEKILSNLRKNAFDVKKRIFVNILLQIIMIT